MVTKRDIARVVNEPYESALSMANIKSGYAKCGIFPFNRRAIPLKLLPSEFHVCTPISSNACGSNSPITNETDDGMICESMPEVTVADSAADQNTECPSNDIQDQSMSSNSPSISRPISSTPIVSSTPSATVNSTETHFSEIPRSKTSHSVTLHSETLQSKTPCSETPHSEAYRSSNISPSPLSDPLVMVGLVPQNLADILSTSGCEDENKPKRRMFKARVLTE